MAKDSLTDYYKIIKIIGKGGYSKVYEVLLHFPHFNSSSFLILLCFNFSVNSFSRTII